MEHVKRYRYDSYVCYHSPRCGHASRQDIFIVVAGFRSKVISRYAYVTRQDVFNVIATFRAKILLLDVAASRVADPFNRDLSNRSASSVNDMRRTFSDVKLLIVKSRSGMRQT